MITRSAFLDSYSPGDNLQVIVKDFGPIPCEYHGLVEESIQITSITDEPVLEALGGSEFNFDLGLIPLDQISFIFRIKIKTETKQKDTDSAKKES